jgi:non-specific serine/threonine protein kinase
VAHALADRFANGSRWLDLSLIDGPGHVWPAIASALSLNTHGETTTLCSLTKQMRDRHVLLVLDNTEHVPDIGRTLSDLMSGAPRLTVIVTGRSPLGIRSEQRYAVHPLSGEASRSARRDSAQQPCPAVELFFERARSAAPRLRCTDDDSVVAAELCARLDGLPLAIELVAAQADILSLKELRDLVVRQLPLSATGARDLPARQQTLSQTVAWSYDRLSLELRVALRQLSVFAGGFTLDAAAAVLRTPSKDDAATNLTDIIRELVDQSLVFRHEERSPRSRYSMLNVTRSYALERLAEDTDSRQAHGRHADYFLSLVQRAEAESGGPDASAWFDQLEEDHDNLRAALAWAIDHDERTVAVQLVTDLWRFWYIRGYLREGRTWLERTLAALGEEPTSERVTVLNALGAFASVQEDMAAEARYIDEALGLARELGDMLNLARSLHRRGNVARGNGNIDEAKHFYEESLSCFREVGDESGAAAVRNNLGLVAIHQGNLESGRTFLEESLEGYRRIGDRRGTAIALCNLGQHRADADGATSAFHSLGEALSLFRSLRDSSGSAWVLQALAELAADHGATLLAARLFGAAMAHRDAIGWKFSPLEQEEYAQALATLREHMGERTFQIGFAAGEELTLDQITQRLLPMLATRLEGEGRSPAGLTPREVDVLQLVAEGLTNAEIANRLSLSPHTIDAHLRRIYRKLAVRSRSAASRLAVEHDLV